VTDLKRQKWKRWLVRLFKVVAAGFILLNLLAYRHAWAMMHFEAGKPRTGLPETLSIAQKIGVLLWGVNLPRPHTDLAVTVLGSAAKSLQIGGTGNIRLGAWYCPGPAKSPLVVLFHGYGGEKSGTVAEAKVFLELGCSVLLVDFRGSGDSSESYTTIGYLEAEDVAAAVRYAQQNLAPSRIVLYGESMGAAAELRAVHSCGVKPDAIIVEAVFDRLLNTVRHRFEAMNTPSFPSAELLIFWGGTQAGFNGFKHNPVDYARSVTCPILFLHGAADSRAHVEEARRVYEAVPGVKQFREFLGVGHAAIISRFPVEWKQTVGDFLKHTIWQSGVP
jgi:pimeloyl-ACP methyl ester carboxylesterase